jgi:hypothetical protein
MANIRMQEPISTNLAKSLAHQGLEESHIIHLSLIIRWLFSSKTIKKQQITTKILA